MLHLSTYKTIKKNDKLPANLSEEITWNKICVYLIFPYVIRIEAKKENLHLKSVTMIYPVTQWFEISQYNDKRAISIADIVETTWLSIYPITIEPDQPWAYESIGHKFRKYLIETYYGINDKPRTFVNTIHNAVL